MAKEYCVSFRIEVPDDVPERDLEDFLRFELGEVGSMAGTNALASKDLHSLDVTSVSVELAW